MKIESNEASKSYINTEATWNHGKEITLDEVKVIPATVIDMIMAKMEKELENYPLYNHEDMLLKRGYERAISDLKWTIKNTEELKK